MIPHFSEIIPEWMGGYLVPPDDISDAPPGGGSINDRVVHRIGLFRNRIIISSPAMSITGFGMFAGPGEGSVPGFFIPGIVAGSSLTAITGFWILRFFNEVLREGQVVPMNRRDNTTRSPSALSLPVVITPELVLFGLLPGMTMKVMIAFMGGLLGCFPGNTHCRAGGGSP